MRLDRFAGGKGRLAIAMALTLGPALALSYFGFQSVASREQAIRVSYTATSVLIRDRLLAEWAALESNLGRDESEVPGTTSPVAAFQAWLKRTDIAQGWDAEPFLIRGDGAIATTTLTYGWSSAPIGGEPSARGAAVVFRDAERSEARGDERLALRQYGQALTLATSPGERASAQSRMGRVLFKLGRFDEGLAAYRAVMQLDAGIRDPHGIPYAAMARAQIVDGLEATGRTRERGQAGIDLLRWTLAHPWDEQDGYGAYVARARRAATAADTDLDTHAAHVTHDLHTLEWLHRDVRPRLQNEAPAAGDMAARRRLTSERDGRTMLISAHAVRQAPGDAPLWLGAMVGADDVAGPILDRVLAGVELGPALVVSLLDEQGRQPRAGATASPLGSADLGALLPGWRVAILDTNGRTLQQVGRRERWVYGTLVAGTVSLLLIGVLIAARVWMKEAELSRLRTDFVSNVSHELKTPLALIRMFGETLESGLVTDPSRQQEFHGIIRRESERLTHLINNVLDAAKIDAGTKRFVLAPGDLLALIRETLDAYAPLFTRLGFDVATDLPRWPVLVHMDRDAIAQALVNLFQNAIKYSPTTKSVAVSLTAGDDHVRLAVTDRGIGIDPSEVPRIFDKYYRIATGDAAGSSGSGIGLAIVAHTMAAHHGRVDVTSAPGDGSTFTLVFPRAGRATDRTAPDRSADEAGVLKGSVQ